MVEVTRQWFSREEAVSDLQGCEFLRKRKAFFDENNEDFRLKQPGVKWALVKEKRLEVYNDCISRIQDVFDELHEKITGEKRVSISSPLPVLPTIKTPAISKLRSRTKIPHECYVADTTCAENIPPQSPIKVDSQQKSVRRSLRTTRQSTRLLSEIQPTTNTQKLHSPAKIPQDVAVDGTTRSENVPPETLVKEQPPCSPVPQHPVRQSTSRTTRQSTRLLSKVQPTAKTPKLRSRTKIPQESAVDCAENIPPKTPNKVQPPPTASTPVTQQHPVSQSTLRQSTRLLSQIQLSPSIQKLQEEHRSRTKGKILSLAELRNARASPACKKTKPRSKVPVEEPCVPPVVGSKRLRSVSLEKLSTGQLPTPNMNKTAKMSIDSEEKIPDVQTPLPAVAEQSEPMDTSLDTVDQLPAVSEGETMSSDEACQENKSSPESGSPSQSSEESSQDEVSPLRPDCESENVTVERTSFSGTDGDSPDNPDSSPDNYTAYDCHEEASQDADPNSCPDSAGSTGVDRTKTVTKLSKFPKLNFFSKIPTPSVTDAKGESKASGVVPFSFLPRNSPRKLESFQSRQEKLASKVLKKKEEEERRKDELRKRKQQELQEKIRKREERAKRVAEKQAALRKLHQAEKKKKLEDFSSHDEQMKKVNQMKAKELEEKNKKLRERMHAAETRRKLDEEQQKKKFQQMEEERRMVAELAAKRKELEEEDKRQKRLEKLKVERERQLQREAEIREREEEKRRLNEEEERKVAEANKRNFRQPPTLDKKQIMDPKMKLEQLLESTIPKASNAVGTCKDDHTNRFLQQWSKTIKGNTAPRNMASPKPSAANTTFTVSSHPLTTPDKNTATTISAAMKTPDNYHVLPGSTLALKMKEKLQEITSYEMTPAEKDPLFAYENYDIGNLSSEDTTDDEDCPRKEVPLWARPEALNRHMEIQETAMEKNKGSVAHIFPPEQLLRDPDLARIFKQKRKRFYQRSSSAQWDSPMYKRNRVE